ncbi:MAG: photosystem II S4 domain protein [Firmicutes bacterium]|nr:photosystem II S4 domain protein [Bacillota bacterium]
MIIFDKDRFLGHLDGQEKETGSRILDLAAQAYEGNKPAYSDFLNPREQEIATGIVRGTDFLAYYFDGGYSTAERRRLAVFPNYFPRERIEVPLKALAVTGTAEFTGVTHRDFLGAVLGCGIRREKVGDIILTDRGAQIVLAPEVAVSVENTLQSVQRVPAIANPIELEQLDVAPKQIKEIRTTVASMRLDAVAGAGFGTSRTQMVREIKRGTVRVNWQPVENPAQEIQEGDILSIRGRGRVEVAEQMGLTRKGRIHLLLQRYI